MAKRKGFMVYFEWIDTMQELSAEDFKRIMTDARVYADTGRTPEYKEPVLRMLWTMLRSRLDEDGERYARTVQRRSEAAHKRWDQEPSKERKTGRTNTPPAQEDTRPIPQWERRIRELHGDRYSPEAMNKYLDF